MQVKYEHKSDQAFRTISEVSDDLGIPPHVLRFWESRFEQIQPLKSKGGRRYYRPEDVDVLRRIKSLLYSQGYTIKGAQKAVDFPQDMKRTNTLQEKNTASEYMSPQQNLTKVSEKLIHNLERASTSARRKQQSELQDVLKDLYQMRDLLKKIVATN
jgi:DNA-binding transcriptional MerR regulator